MRPSRIVDRPQITFIYGTAQLLIKKVLPTKTYSQPHIYIYVNQAAILILSFAVLP